MTYDNTDWSMAHAKPWIQLIRQKPLEEELLLEELIDSVNAFLSDIPAVQKAYDRHAGYVLLTVTPPTAPSNRLSNQQVNEGTLDTLVYLLQRAGHVVKGESFPNGHKRLLFAIPN